VALLYNVPLTYQYKRLLHAAYPIYHRVLWASLQGFSLGSRTLGVASPNNDNGEGYVLLFLHFLLYMLAKNDEMELLYEVTAAPDGHPKPVRFKFKYELISHLN
jgi:hypothetical protein